MIRRVLPYMKKYRVNAFLSPIAMVLEVFADIGIPYLMSRIVDVGIKNQDADYVVKTGLLMILAALGAMLMGIVSAFMGARAGFGFAAELRQAAYRRIQRYSFANIDEMSVPSLITRLTTDANVVGQVAMMTLRMAVRSPMMMVFALFMVVKVNAELATIFVVAVPLVFGLFALVFYKVSPMFRKIQKKVDGINAITQENFAGIRVVKSFNRKDYEEARFDERNKDLLTSTIKAVLWIIFLFPMMSLIVYSVIISALWFGGHQIMAGTMESGELIAFTTYIGQIMMSLMMLSMYIMMATRGKASLTRIIEVLDVESEIVEAENPVKEVADGSVSFSGVCFRYPGYKDDILHEINLEIRSGERIGIIGSTGSSKSTLVQMIPRLYDVSCGEVCVGGRNVKDYDIKTLRDEVAFVLQKNTLVTGTIRSNMQWGDENASDEEIIRALKQAQAWEFVSGYEEGLDYHVEQGGGNFSGGQRQRLTIARALVKKPKILILDDSTSAVDMTTDAKLRKTFREDLDGITTIIIAQRIASIEDSDRIIVMEQGRVENVGTHEELLQKSQIYREIYESQKGGLAQ
ncbi:MAG TPA: ABC transporter ATP-binding protein [Bacillota bacterium]|nr:ABC transporter ATP-binding protein [Bacillota bacterium]